MFSSLILRTFYSGIVLTAGLPQQSKSIGAGPTRTSNSSSPANILTPSLDNNITSGNKFKITCDGTRYGKNPKVPSCQNAFGYLRMDETPFKFSERDSGVPYDIPLPWRTLSNDGLCLIQPYLKQGAVSGTVSPTEIGQAAVAVLQLCVIERGVGGMVTNIGGDNNLDVAVASYKPSVKCDATSNPGPPWVSCISIFSNMKASKLALLFGRPGPGIQVELPLVLEAADGKGQVRVDIDGPATIATWYGVWEAVTSIASMCTRRKEKGGKAKNVGLGGKISVELSATRESFGEISENASTVTLADAGVEILQDFAPQQPDVSAFGQVVPSELVTGVAQGDDISPVTLPGGAATNDSAVAGA